LTYLSIPFTDLGLLAFPPFPPFPPFPCSEGELLKDGLEDGALEEEGAGLTDGEQLGALEVVGTLEVVGAGL
jgi:hypothetical protein